MRRPTGLVLAAAGVTLATLGASLTASVAIPPGSGRGFDVDRVQWSRLEYRARKFFLTARSEVDLELVPGDELRRELPSLDRERAALLDGPGVLLELRSHLLGRHSLSQLWLEPRRAGTLRGMHTDSGKRHRRKTYRFGRDSVEVERREPADRDEEELPPHEWSKASDSVIAYPDSRPASITEPTSIFYLLSVVDLKTLEGGIELATVARSRISGVELRLEGREEIKADYVVESPSGGETVRQGPTEALLVSLRPRSLTGESDEETVEFLGLEGDIELHLDPELRVPLQIRGRIPPVGGVTVRLQRVVLR